MARPYSTLANIYDDPAAEPVEITWYFALPGAKRFPGHHAFGSMIWQSDTREYPVSTPGEVGLERYRANPRVVKESGQGPIATPMSWFLDGAPTSFVPRDCCGNAIPRGCGELGRPSLWGWFANRQDWRNVGMTERGGPGALAGGFVPGAAELAGPDVLRDYDQVVVRELAAPDGLYGDRMPTVAELAGPDGMLAGSAAELAGPYGLIVGDVAELVGPGVTESAVPVGIGELGSGAVGDPPALPPGALSCVHWDGINHLHEGTPPELPFPFTAYKDVVGPLDGLNPGCFYVWNAITEQWDFVGIGDIGAHDIVFCEGPLLAKSMQPGACD